MTQATPKEAWIPARKAPGARPARTELPPILPRVVAGPARLMRELQPDELDAHRYLACEQYAACLDQARPWRGFSCMGCPQKRPNEGFGRWESFFTLAEYDPDYDDASGG